MGRKGNNKGKMKSHGRRVMRTKKYRTSNDDNDDDDKNKKIIPPPEWVININNCLEEGPDLDSGRSWTIYRIPKNMVQVHKSAYIPKIISIGPFHYGDLRLQAMEEHKMRYLFRILGYTGNTNNIQLDQMNGHCSSSHHDDDDDDDEDQLQDDDQLATIDQRRHHQSSNSHVRRHRRKDIRIESLEEAMKLLERKTRECYSESFYNIDSDDFVQMMVIDGCFVIELLRLYHEYYVADDEETVVEDPIFTTRWMLRTLQRDLLMLQNQLPFFVLEELFNLTSIPGQDNVSLIELTLKFFDPLVPRDEKIDMPELVNPSIPFDHLLDLFRDSFISSVKHKKPISCGRKLHHRTPSSSVRFAQERQLIHCVRELQEAGVKFMKNEENDLLDIEYEDGVLQIPPLYIDDNTVPLFLNFVAYEQCDQEAEPYFTNYFMFFDSLVNASKDVEILHNNGIINHVLGSDKDVANLFNKLCREIIYDVENCHLSKEMKGVNDYYKAYYATRWHVWWTNLIRDYFSSPWTFLSLLAAIVLLLLTTAQTFFAFYAYFKPPKQG
ncbi:Protein of unknown function DUF247 [Macleaya cordata]|uniref:Uncharacterized protein n=1 Tax=Macleaya cordata TaxID=56857 RepID=A0A200RAI2_MACCD|nr:Protein of unknown function DUF247 [Macleaya cordata]